MERPCPSCGEPLIPSINDDRCGVCLLAGCTSCVHQDSGLCQDCHPRETLNELVREAQELGIYD